jgi:hypothetical protein
MGEHVHLVQCIDAKAMEGKAEDAMKLKTMMRTNGEHNSEEKHTGKE